MLEVVEVVQFWSDIPIIRGFIPGE